MLDAEFADQLRLVLRQVYVCFTSSRAMTMHNVDCVLNYQIQDVQIV